MAVVGLVGSLISDVGRNLLAAAVALGLGLVMGFRPDGGVTGVALAVGLLLVFAFGLSWVWALLGLTLRSANAVTMTSFLVQFPPPAATCCSCLFASGVIVAVFAPITMHVYRAK